MIETRENKINSESEKIDSITIELGNKTSDLDESLRGAKRESAMMREDLISSGEKLRAEMIEKTKSEASGMFEEKMKQLEVEIKESESKLSSEIDVFTKKIEALFT